MNTAIIINELKFKAVRSSGAGGQHVNKVSSKVELVFNILDSKGLTDEEKLRITQKLTSRITKSGELILNCGDTRSQHRNKELVISRCLDILKASLLAPKPRKRSKPTKSSIKKRLESKKRQALKKSNRRKPLL
ncbi:aminoacyl-tRNA hydrolase [Aquimarina sp. MMG015]|uniref:alternative ribosome rescue aminoacyl-tRNA hydrolase ArfB n=1 Tax=Aquimarina TaxID=290174 RepID=UPI0003F9CE0F|nr:MULTISPECIES: alternative ribosome rescue aminoacyl-tRNA hydrolase ArfB [Aquimarina]AXT56991.1 aminoacyl-tRNA hydrolase [Aquimarina sp. AD1]MBQ4801764.1 aminoacyl-tRNA hydrolase [Aquimarina sp. MMG015]RKN36937.1 aminoacyl-tRNA hydrolase [Aquimarina sp. AD1]